MQSGISASKELLSHFNELLGTPTHFGLLAGITNESLQPIRFLTPTSSSWETNLSTLLSPHLIDTQALYIILRRHDTTPSFVAITYIPDRCPVRQKMLFASTRLTLVRELGTEHFRETIFANSAAELTKEGFERHDAHEAMEAPLTREERELGDVKRAEEEAGSSHIAAGGVGVVGGKKKAIHMGSHVSMPIDEGAMEAIKGFGNGGVDVAMLKINSATETVVLAPDAPTSTPSSITSLISSISTQEPRFTFFRYAHTHNGEEYSPVLFLYTCPMGANRSIKDRMMYPLMKRAVMNMAEEGAGVVIDKRFEVDDPAEVTEESVLAELHPKVIARAGFARPKRPGR